MLIESIGGEYRRYKKLGEAVLDRLSDEELNQPLGPHGNSVTMLVWHLGGNLTSRFTDFLTSDGEKPWRNRDEEFQPRVESKVSIMEKWNGGWATLFSALGTLSDDSLGEQVKIRGEALTVADALTRSLAHTAYHVGQMVWVGKGILGKEWESLSIPLGKSEEANKRIARQKE